MFTPFAFVKSVSAGGGNDPDAQAFIDATGISGIDATAINTLVIDLKGYSLWTRMKVIYPMVGGTSTTCKYNLKNPIDTNAGYRITFNGGWTFSSTGADPNGTNAYGNTYFAMSSLTTNDNHISYYSRGNSAGVMIGVDFNIRYWIAPNFNDSIGYAPIQTSAASSFTYYPDTSDFYIGTRTASNISKLYRNASNIESPNDTSAATENQIFTLAARNGGSVGNYFGGECAFASIGDGLDATQVSNFNIAVQAFNTTLSRNV